MAPPTTSAQRRGRKGGRAALLGTLGTLALASGAQAAPTVPEALEIADRYWGPHQCAGRMVITEDPTLVARGHGGEATGIAWRTWTGSEWTDWYVRACEATVAPGMDDRDRCQTIVHEVGHMVHGPDHVGPMAPGAIRPWDCWAQPRPAEPERAQPERAQPEPQPEPVSERQMRYRERRHAHYHRASRHPERRRLATKWHRLAAKARAARARQDDRS